MSLLRTYVAPRPTEILQIDTHRYHSVVHIEVTSLHGCTHMMHSQAWVIMSSLCKYVCTNLGCSKAATMACIKKALVNVWG